MNKKIFKILSLMLGITPITIAPSMTYQNKIEKEEYQNEFLIKTELARIERLDGNVHNVVFTKIIKDLNDRKVLLIAFNNIYSIVDISTLMSLETKWIDISEYKDNNNLFYIPIQGLFIKINGTDYQQIESKEIVKYNDIKDDYIRLYLEKDSFFKEQEYQNREEELKLKFNNDKSLIVDKRNPYTEINASVHYGNEKLFISQPNVSHITPHSWWWLTRDNFSRMGYDDDRADEYFNKRISSGWCCYNALANLLLYNEIFKHPGKLFSNEEFNKYFTYELHNSNEPYYSSPIYRWNKFNDNASSDDERKTLVYNLHKLNNKNYNNFSIPNTGMNFNKLYRKFVEGKDTEKYYREVYSDSWWYTAHYVWEYITKRHLLVIMTTVNVDKKYKSFDHAFVVYGYDNKTNQFLITNLWGNRETNACLINYQLWAGNYSFFTIIPQNYDESKAQHGKYFLYKGKHYDWKYIEEVMVYDNTLYNKK
ncbi:putative cysteine peptidase [Mycoplasmopsis verecunda]|uniref:Uncharacterized protein n=1 Tax=Mycoplasmopsis verecunda TaxID=171291 RepID=A0A1T4KSS6_9BACT|nr:hypothetical protein [Mycoplasmopsis verecunda]SJZ45461.1 hypothetical protein SAMN02745154_00163 [Mycoplasmopsis verecunda]